MAADAGSARVRHYGVGSKRKIPAESSCPQERADFAGISALERT
jgi:hypothetical protein